MKIWRIILLVLGIAQTLHVGVIFFLGFPVGVITFAGVVMVFIWLSFVDSRMRDKS